MVTPQPVRHTILEPTGPVPGYLCNQFCLSEHLYFSGGKWAHNGVVVNSGSKKWQSQEEDVVFVLFLRTYTGGVDTEPYQ